MKIKQKYAKWQIGSVIEKLLEQSRWFRVEPLPFDVFEVTVKEEHPALPKPLAPTEAGQLIDAIEWLDQIDGQYVGGLTPEGVREFSDYFYHGITPSEAIRLATKKAEAENSNHTMILQHRIAWWLRGESAPEELDDCSVEHIEKLIKEGYNQGELCVLGNDGDTEYRGWWRIVPAC